MNNLGNWVILQGLFYTMVLNKFDNEEKIIGKKLYDYQHGAIDKIFHWRWKNCNFFWDREAVYWEQPSQSSDPDPPNRIE